MNNYQIQANIKTISYGITIHEVDANSKEEAMKLYHHGDANCIDEFTNASESETTDAEIIHESKITPDLFNE